MATRLSLRRMGDSTGKLIAAPDSVAELLEKATKKLNPRTSGGETTGRVPRTPYQPTNSLRTRVRPRHDQPTNSVGLVRDLSRQLGKAALSWNQRRTKLALCCHSERRTRGVLARARCTALYFPLRRGSGPLAE